MPHMLLKVSSNSVTLHYDTVFNVGDFRTGWYVRLGMDLATYTMCDMWSLQQPELSIFESKFPLFCGYTHHPYRSACGVDYLKDDTSNLLLGESH